MAFANNKAYSVAVFMVDRAYGGPEEGGWWYTYGEPVERFEQFIRYFTNEDEAYTYARRLNRWLCDRLNEGRPDIGSVLSRGRYQAEVNEGTPERYPATRPHYE